MLNYGRKTIVEIFIELLLLGWIKERLINAMKIIAPNISASVHLK